MKELNKVFNEIKAKEQKVRDLTQKLSSSVSSIGDWKVAKCMEYHAMGIEMPYDIKQLHAERQIVRDEINQLQKDIHNLKEQLKDGKKS